MINYKKTILTTSLWTLLGLIIASGLILMFMIFVFPRNLANFCYSLGMQGSAANLYYSDYQKSNDINCIYKSLNIEISCANYDKIIKYYKEFVADDEYAEFLDSYKKYNEGLNIGVLEKSTLLNEENYLANKYISALIATDQNSQAWNLALDYFADYKQFTLANQGVYALSKFVGNISFDRTPQGYDDNLINCMQEYFDMSVQLFLAQSEPSTLEKSYLISLGNRIIQVGQDINTIYTSEDKQQLELENSAKMLEVNNVIKGLI